jgi:septum formation protein
MLILASQSPRRVELLNQLGVVFSQKSVDIDETPQLDESPQDYVLRMAVEKSEVAWSSTEKSYLVLGADTCVVSNERILGKPKNQLDAARMLGMLADSSHQVLTAVAVTTQGQQKSILVTTEVTFGPLNQQTIDWYWHTKEPQDKAGSYGIQGLGGQFVKQIKGSYSAVVGLPLYETKVLLSEFGVSHEC